MRAASFIVVVGAAAGLGLGLLSAYEWWSRGQRLPSDAERVTGLVVDENQGLLPESLNIVEVRYAAHGRELTARFPVAGTKGNDPGDVSHRPGDQVELFVARSRPSWASLISGETMDIEETGPDRSRLGLAAIAAVGMILAVVWFQRQGQQQGGFRWPWP